MVDYYRMDSSNMEFSRERKKPMSNARHYMNYCLMSLIFVVIGYLIGYFSSLDSSSIGNIKHSSYVYVTYENESDETILKDYLNQNIDVNNIKNHLKFLSSIPHLAGTDGDKISADYVRDEWYKNKLDDVQLVDYNVYLDFPVQNKYNNLIVKDSMNRTETLYEIKEETFDPELDYSKIPQPFLAYSLNGSVDSDEIYYANYCSETDFRLLTSLGISVENKTVLCKYGNTFRGNKVKNAQEFGAKAVILFDDPLRVAPNYATNETYPNGQFLPKFGTQRGTIYWKEGDPLTPTYPSIESAYRIDAKDQDGLPKIVAQVVGYEIARQIFLIMDDSRPAPKEWQGELDVKYLIGGKLKNNRTVTLNVFNEKKISKVYNVIGAIKGSLEPDRYILVGNHRDAWTFGAVDPSIGTAILLEVSRVLAELRNTQKWTPKRSIIFLSWSAEEYGLLGSTEWVEEFEKKLTANSVVYLNLDFSIYGNFSYEARASPLLYDLLYNVTKSIQIDEKETVFDRWLENDPNEQKTLPNISPYLGSGSDHMPFLQRAGIPCIDQKFGRKKSNPLSSKVSSSYPAYHSSYETFKLVNDYLDPNFKASKLMATIVSKTAFTVSNSLILPFNTSTYSHVLYKEFNIFRKKYQTLFDELKISFDGLELAIRNFSVVCDSFMQRVKSIDKTQYKLIRQYNEQLRTLENSFLDFARLKDSGYMHSLFAPNYLNKYYSLLFPNLSKAIYNYEENKSQKNIESIKLQLSIVIYYIQSASSILRDPLDFTRYA